MAPSAGPLSLAKFLSLRNDCEEALRVPLIPLCSSFAFAQIAHHGSPSLPACACAMNFSMPRLFPVSWNPRSLSPTVTHWGWVCSLGISHSLIAEILQINPKPASMFAFSPALLQDRREVLTATSTSGNPN